jgi:DNA-binding beta-propeller fold protein YncE
VIQSGSDPEQFDVSKNGNLLFASNENSSAASIVDVATGKVTHTFPVGRNRGSKSEPGWQARIHYLGK